MTHFSWTLVIRLVIFGTQVFRHIGTDFRRRLTHGIADKSWYYSGKVTMKRERLSMGSKVTCLRKPEGATA
ncbi:hypothetical protein TUN199_11496 [Pyrenophora tritici-repentis]|nr:hypothetical protein Alg215_11074 [Pyrenophora tritici-repentis]KAI0571614.1 hypothetical protein Alg130_10819 [Pyrenophora tritici-repentis]KAI0604045.1 hypothetical protein TUN205_11708 [Pyrenophora tritici-repentis]KAI0616511.1 hypothetical protein TUN199_11496 [Pyrenophora tritici-repentis]